MIPYAEAASVWTRVSALRHASQPKMLRTANKPLDNTGPQADTMAVIPYASQLCSEVPIVSNRAALGDEAFVGFSKTLNEAPGRESQYRMPDPFFAA
jgi:hypothetical protein